MINKKKKARNYRFWKFVKPFPFIKIVKSLCKIFIGQFELNRNPYAYRSFTGNVFNLQMHSPFNF